MVRWPPRVGPVIPWLFPLPQHGRSGTHWLDDPADVSSQNGSGRHTLDEGFSTRSRKVVGSSPTSGFTKPQLRSTYRASGIGVRRVEDSVTRTIASWGLWEARLRRKRILGGVIEGGEDLGSEESERQGPQP
jgi:hypothetical protein